jgi:hypothetical protein
VRTLHEVYEEGGDELKAAIAAFGARHPTDAEPGCEPDWKQAQKHFVQLVETIMKDVPPPPHIDAAGTVRRAEDAAIGFLLAVHQRRGYRCPVCVLQGLPTSSRPSLRQEAS